MAKKKCPECPECMPEWLAAFGDLMSLLLCFFVLLLSMSTMDAKKITEAIGSLAGAMSVLDGGTKTVISKSSTQEGTTFMPDEKKKNESEKSAEQAVSEANEMMQESQGPAITVDEGENGFVIKLPSALLFEAGSATIKNQDALLFLKRMALIIAELPNEMEVSVQGYTDNTKPNAQSIYKDNWELSTARAIAVLHELITDSVDPKRLSVAGFAQYHPVATNMTASGREKNRRVELHFYGKKNEQKNRKKLSILEKSQAK